MKYFLTAGTLFALMTNSGSALEAFEPEIEFEIDLDYYESMENDVTEDYAIKMGKTNLRRNLDHESYYNAANGTTYDAYYNTGYYGQPTDYSSYNYYDRYGNYTGSSAYCECDATYSDSY